MKQRFKYWGEERKNMTDVQKEDLKGNVRHVMQTNYKAHGAPGAVQQGKIEVEKYGYDFNFIKSFDEKGYRVRSEKISGTFFEIDVFNNKREHIESCQYWLKDKKLYQKTIKTYTEYGKQLESITLNADESLAHKHIYKYNEAGKELESIFIMGHGGEHVYERNVKEYDEKGNLLSNIVYNKEGEIRYEARLTYNEQGKQIESKSEWLDHKDNNFHWIKRKFNENGDCIEENYYHKDGSLEDTFTYTHEYDSEGKKIVKPVKPYEEPKASGQTEEFEFDVKGNWVKQTVFYNKKPVNIVVREINYYDEEEKIFEHRLLMEGVETEEPAEEAPDKEQEENNEAEAKYLAEANMQHENFPLQRFYAHRFKAIPSVLIYTGPYIEALNLLEELKKDMRAKLIHSTAHESTGWPAQLSRYTLIFKEKPGYVLYATGINRNNAEEYEIPDHIDADDFVYFSQLQLLRPTEDSHYYDDYFEEQLGEYISSCTLKKQPDKPVINMIETSQKGFQMKEHAVDDNFEIKDLDLNYGHGFAEFHDELMKRFMTSTKGLILFHGLPGTGKTYYIRHLLRKMVSHNKVVIYMPPNMVDHMVNPDFITFLMDEVENWSNDGYFCVLLIEDAEPLLAKRTEGIRIQGITNLLNMTDGLLNDMLNLQIICTFNVDLKKLDSALLRPGRLIARKEFKALSKIDANILAQRMGIKRHFDGAATLGEIYSLLKGKNTLIHDVEPDKNASTTADDF